MAKNRPNIHNQLCIVLLQIPSWPARLPCNDFAFQDAVEIDDFDIKEYCCPKSQDFDPCNPCDWLAAILSLIAFGGIFYFIKVSWLYLGVPTLPDLLEWILKE